MKQLKYTVWDFEGNDGKGCWIGDSKAVTGWWYLNKNGEIVLEWGGVIESYTPGRFDILLWTGENYPNGEGIYNGDIVEIDDTKIGAKEIYQGEVYYCTDYTLESNPCYAIWALGKHGGHARMSPSIKKLGHKYTHPGLLKEIE